MLNVTVGFRFKFRSKFIIAAVTSIVALTPCYAALTATQLV